MLADEPRHFAEVGGDLVKVIAAVNFSAYSLWWLR
jgi:hypothetical protein